MGQLATGSGRCIINKTIRNEVTATRARKPKHPNPVQPNRHTNLGRMVNIVRLEHVVAADHFRFRCLAITTITVRSLLGHHTEKKTASANQRKRKTLRNLSLSICLNERKWREQHTFPQNKRTRGPFESKETPLPHYAVRSRLKKHER